MAEFSDHETNHPYGIQLLGDSNSIQGAGNEG